MHWSKITDFADSEANANELYTDSYEEMMIITQEDNLVPNRTRSILFEFSRLLKMNVEIYYLPATPVV